MRDPSLQLTSASRAVALASSAASESRRLFLKRHPDAARYAGFGDFSLYRFEIAGGHLVTGFGRIVDLTPAELLGREDFEERAVRLRRRLRSSVDSTKVVRKERNRRTSARPPDD